MRVCFVNNLYGERSKGGAEKVVAEEANRLSALGHEVAVISVGDDQPERGAACSPDERCSDAGEIREYGISPRNLYVYGDGRRHSRAAKFLWHLIDAFGADGPRQVIKIIDEINPDVVHTHNLMGIGFRLPRLLGKRGLRHVHTVHDVQLVNPSGLMRAWGSGSLLVFFEKWHGRLMARLFGSPDSVVFPSEFMERFHARFGFFAGATVSILRNPAPAAIGEPRSFSESSDTKFLFVGQLEEHKGLKTLIEAWLSADIKHATLEIVGRGSLDEFVAQAASENSTIVQRGRLEGAALGEAYRQADFCVVPSLVIENAPTVISESFAAGTPVVALASGGIPELVRDGETGFLVSFDQPESLSAGSRESVQANLATALRDAATERSDVWLLMSENCRRVAAQQTGESHVESLLQVYAAE